jgi:hypothetical protein
MGEGEGIVYMKRILRNQGNDFPPPFLVFEMGEVPAIAGGGGRIPTPFVSTSSTQRPSFPQIKEQIWGKEKE